MKIKKTISIIAGTVLIIIMAACDNKDNKVKQTITSSGNVNEVLQQGMTRSVTPTPVITATPSPAPTAMPIDTSDSTDKTDVDLTVLSSTMVYSEVYNMMTKPEEYVGRTIKMSGSFATFINEEDGRFIFGCVITDATACCAQGIEFELTDDYKYPDDYPKDGDTICVTGTFDTYQEDQFTYCTLRNARLL